VLGWRDRDSRGCRDLEKGVAWVVDSLLALHTEVKVWTHRAVIPQAGDGLAAPVTEVRFHGWCGIDRWRRLNLEEGVGCKVGDSLLTLVAEVKVWTDSAVIPQAVDGVVAPVTHKGLDGRGRRRRRRDHNRIGNR